jgi:hypothetical protein
MDVSQLREKIVKPVMQIVDAQMVKHAKVEHVYNQQHAGMEHVITGKHVQVAQQIVLGM